MSTTPRAFSCSPETTTTTKNGCRRGKWLASPSAEDTQAFVRTLRRSKFWGTSKEQGDEAIDRIYDAVLESVSPSTLRGLMRFVGVQFRKSGLSCGNQHATTTTLQQVYDSRDPDVHAAFLLCMHRYFI